MIEVAELRASHARLHLTVRGLDDDQVRRPSLLPGWSIGHVITHLARNADSVVRRLVAAQGGNVVDQYPGGAAGRAAEIDDGAGRSAQDLANDLEAADLALDDLVGTIPAEVWERQVRRGGAAGPLMPAHRMLRSRWREVEVHHVDLGLTYTPADWPAALVDLLLPDLVAGLAARTDPVALAAWAMDRAEAPQLRSWDS